MKVSAEESNAENIPKIDPYDTNGLKRTLDAQTKKLVEDLGFPEIHKLSNIKALFAQFQPKPFMEAKLEIGICVVCYFILSGALSIIGLLLEKDIIMFAKYSKGSSAKNMSLKIKAFLPKYQENYKLVFNLKGFEVETENSVGKYFSNEGELDLSALRKDVEKSLVKLTQKLE
eukprot:maker-scaffold_1-snap-gene-7.34-mRNA-1 protein AED:0.13 eAED:0.13 QI:181/0.83/1/1/0.66/0.57/7/131/172